MISWTEADEIHSALWRSERGAFKNIRLLLIGRQT